MSLMELSERTRNVFASGSDRNDVRKNAVRALDGVIKQIRRRHKHGTRDYNRRQYAEKELGKRFGQTRR